MAFPEEPPDSLGGAFPHVGPFCRLYVPLLLFRVRSPLFSSRLCGMFWSALLVLGFGPRRIPDGRLLGLGNFPEYRLGDERCPIIIILAVDNFGGFQATSRDFRPKSLKDGRDWTRQTEHLQHASREQPPASPHLRDARRLSSVVVQHGKVAIWGKCMQLPSMVRCRFSYLLVPKTSGLTTQCNTLKPTGCRQSLVFRETIKGIVVAN